MTVRNRFSPRVSVVLECGAGRTKQSMRDECDINNIMKKYVKTGTVAHVAKHGGSYGFAPAYSLQEAFEVIEKARAMFAELPAQVRRKFDNEPAKFLAFVQDEKNLDAMREMGLARKAERAPSPAPAPAPTPQ